LKKSFSSVEERITKKVGKVSTDQTIPKEQINEIIFKEMQLFADYLDMFLDDHVCEVKERDL